MYHVATASGHAYQPTWEESEFFSALNLYHTRTDTRWNHWLRTYSAWSVPLNGSSWILSRLLVTELNQALPSTSDNRSLWIVVIFIRVGIKQLEIISNEWLDHFYLIVAPHPVFIAILWREWIGGGRNGPTFILLGRLNAPDPHNSIC